VNGILVDVLENERHGRMETLNATSTSNLLFGIVSGMGSLRRRGILRRTLNSSNVFVNEQFEPVIGAFHLTCPFESKSTPILNGPIIFAVDVYPFAVTLYAMFAEAKASHLESRSLSLESDCEMLESGSGRTSDV
jgi:hypothetical protein